MKVKSCPLSYWCSSPERCHYPSWGNRRDIHSCCWDWDAKIQFFSLCLLSVSEEWYESQWGSLSKYFIPHSHFHDDEVGKPAFEPCLFPSSTGHAALFCLRQSWSGGARLINWRLPANKGKKQSPEMQLFPSTEGITWGGVENYLGFIPGYHFCPFVY